MGIGSTLFIHATIQLGHCYYNCYYYDFKAQCTELLVAVCGEVPLMAGDTLLFTATSIREQYMLI